MGFFSFRFPFMASSTRFERLPEDEDFHDDEEAHSPVQPHEKGIFIPEHQKYLAYAYLLISSSMMLLIGLRIGMLASTNNLDDVCFRRQSAWSPLIDDIDLSYHDVLFNGTFGNDSIFRHDPSPEVDYAWRYISTGVGVARMSKEDFEHAGISLDMARLPEEYYGGGYMGFIEVFHQLHCVDFLRKATWFNFDYYKDCGQEFTDDLPRAKEHLVHCIDMLRQTLMCHGDIGIFGAQWTKGYLRPFPNFNTVHKCRNFDNMVSWAYTHEIPKEPPGHQWKPLPEDKIFDNPP